jgi:hypothetical protein
MFPFWGVPASRVRPPSGASIGVVVSPQAESKPIETHSNAPLPHFDSKLMKNLLLVYPACPSGHPER